MLSSTSQNYQDIILPKLSNDGDGDDDKSTTNRNIQEAKFI